MLRRSVLAAASATLAGCGLAPSPPSTDDYPETYPNAVFAFDWDDDASAYEVTFVRGNRLTAANTGALAVHQTREGDEATTLWVGEWTRTTPDGTPSDPHTSFPLDPGATIRIPVDRPATVRVIWTQPDGSTSRSLAQWKQDAQPAATETVTTQSQTTHTEER